MKPSRIDAGRGSSRQRQARSTVEAHPVLREEGNKLRCPTLGPDGLFERRSLPRRAAVGVLAVLLAMLAGATLLTCVLAIGLPMQLDEGEPLIYGLATRILQHQALYQPIDRQPFVQVHYTPLYYAAVAELRRVAGSGFASGRLLSLAAGLVATLLVAYLAGVPARSRWAGSFAALLFLALAFPGGPAPFLVLERVDMLGVALSVLAVAILSHRTGRVHLVAAGVLAGLALLTKQSLFAAALAGTFWLVTFSPRKAGLFALVAALTTLAPVAWLEWSSAGAFWDNIGPSNPNSTALPFGEYLFRELLVIQGVPALLAAFYVLTQRAWKDTRRRLLVVYWLASAISIVGIVKVGANHNYWIEFAAPNAALASLAIWTSLKTHRRRVWAVASMTPVLLLAAQLGALAPAKFLVDRPGDVVPLSWSLSIPQFMGLARDNTAFNDLVHDVSGEKEKVLAESMDVAVLGNHPVQFEPFAFSMLEHENRWDSQPLVADICAGNITLLVLSYPIESDIHPVGLHEFPMWPNSVLAAMRQAMVMESIRARHWLYRPLVSPSPSAIAACEAAAARASA